VSMSGVVSDQQIDYVLRVTNVGPTPANGVYVDLDRMTDEEHVQ